MLKIELFYLQFLLSRAQTNDMHVYVTINFVFICMNNDDTASQESQRRMYNCTCNIKYWGSVLVFNYTCIIRC